MVKIDILDSLVGENITCIMHDGSSISGILNGVSHQDHWDMIIIAGRDLMRSTGVKKIYVKAREVEELVWPPGAEDDAHERERAGRITQMGYSPEIVKAAIGLMDRVVKVNLDDGGEEVGKLEAVTPHVADELPTLHLSDPQDTESGKDGGTTASVIRVANVVAIKQHTLTHGEADGLISEEGVSPAADGDVSGESVAEEPRERADVERGKPVHRQEDADAAFGLDTGSGVETDPGEGPPVPDDTQVQAWTDPQAPRDPALEGDGRAEEEGEERFTESHP